jgi:hypothetical protein
MLILDANRHSRPAPALARWCLGAGIVATPLLERLRPYIGTGTLPDALAASMNTALDQTRAEYPQLKPAAWEARVLPPLRS